MLQQSVRLALLSITRNKLRSFLTLLGIIIGVAAVIAMLTIGSGVREKIHADITALGSNQVFVSAGYRFEPGSPPRDTARALTSEDYRVLARRPVDVEATAAVASKSLRAIFGPNSIQVSAVGVTQDYLRIRNWKVARGRAPTRAEMESGAGVCLIAQAVRKALFGSDSPLSARIRIGQMTCTVIGLLAAKGGSLFADEDTTVILPLEAYQTRIAGNRDVESILLAARPGIMTARIKRETEIAFRQIRRIAPGQDDDFQVEDMTEIIKFATDTIGAFTALLGAIAGISLLVGGIGIMNIMLVSVTERTREIGIRMAIGARQGNILTQFLVEASILSLIGGLSGICLGLAIAWGAALLIGIPFVPSILAILCLSGVSMMIGVVFGFFPALHGARLDPIEALRHE